MVIDKVERIPSYIMVKLDRKDTLGYKNSDEAENGVNKQDVVSESIDGHLHLSLNQSLRCLR